MTITTPEDAIKAASSIARDVADGRLTPADMEAHLETELRALIGTVAGERDPLFDLQVEIARGVLAVSGIPLDELREWVAVARHRAGEPVNEPTADIDPPTPISCASEPHSPETVAAESVSDPEPVAELIEPAPPVAVPPRQDESGGYDPFRGWPPGATLPR